LGVFSYEAHVHGKTRVINMNVLEMRLH